MTVYIGIAVYGGAHGRFMCALLHLQEYLLAKGYTVLFDIVINGSLLAKIRNEHVKRFIDSNADVFLVLDVDMVFQPEDVEKLITAPFDVAVGNYRIKQEEVVWIDQPIYEDGLPKGTTHNGDIWLETAQAGTGIMCIKRHTMLKMVESYPELAYTCKGIQYHALFNLEVIDGAYVGEDYLFCRRLRAIGGQVFMLPDMNVGHVGEAVYSGNYHEYLKG